MTKRHLCCYKIRNLVRFALDNVTEVVVSFLILRRVVLHLDHAMSDLMTFAAKLFHYGFCFVERLESIRPMPRVLLSLKFLEHDVHLKRLVTLFTDPPIGVLFQ